MSEIDVAAEIKATQDRLAAIEVEREKLTNDLSKWRELLGVSEPRRSKRARKRRPIRANSTVFWAQKVLNHIGHDEEVDKLVKAIEELSGLNVQKSTLVSNLSRYVRNDDTFIRPSPGVYGLVKYER